MPTFVRAAFPTTDDLVRICVLCTGCLQELLTDREMPRRWVSDYGSGAGTCELCQTCIEGITSSGES